MPTYQIESHCSIAVLINDSIPFQQLHTSPKQWPRLVHAKEQVEAAVQQAKTQQTAPSPAAFGVGGGSGLNLSGGGFPGMMGAAGGMGTGPIDPNMQNAMTQMMSNPDALRAALQVRK